MSAATLSEPRRGHAALRESEARLRRTLMLLPDPVLMQAGGHVTFANAASEKLFGAGAGELLGCAPLARVHPDSHAAVLERLRALRAGATQAASVETKMMRCDGATRIVELSMVVVESGSELSLLWVLRDVTELKQTKAELARSHDDLRRLVAAQGAIQENERRRIARELHDDLQQRLAAIKMDLCALRQLLPTDPRAAQAMIATIDGLASAAITSSHRIVNDLRPQILDDLGLLPALEALARQFGQRMGVDCSVDSSLDAAAGDFASPDVQTCLYRVAQEGLNNVAKHSRARAVLIQLDGAGGADIVMTISDDGVGMRAEDRLKAGTFGLLGMRERVRALGGSLVIAGHPGAGVTLAATIPTRRDPLARPGA